MAPAIDTLWKKCYVILLKTNHRQGEDHQYADLLNRIRIGKHTDMDTALLESRIYARNSPDLPENALLITGTNKIVSTVNTAKLNQLPAELIALHATVTSRTRGKFIPKLDAAGMVKNTHLQFCLQLKIAAKVMLTYNIDVVDNLTNGTLGEVIGFQKDQGSKVKYVLVKFHNEDSGRDRRKSLNFDRQYPGMNATAIDLLEFEFKLREANASTATAINFRLTLAWATTAHKIQGHTVKKPDQLILDLDCWLQPAMIYVMSTMLVTTVQCSY